MFYANNEQVKGIFLNGRNYNYLVYGFGKIIPEDRSAEQLNLNLAYKYLNKYRIEFGTVKDGYENALVSPRFDKPDSSGVFHTPFTYYYNGNIISTKEVNVLVNNAHWALLNASVYNDININGNITYFATNTDFQGHNVNVFPEGEDEPVYKARLNQPILSNCTNFSFDIQTRFSKQDGYPSVDNCNNFTGNFRYVGNQDTEYPGFRGFLSECKDSVFNIDCTNMHGGGSAANVTNYYNFSGIQSCNNIKLNITGSSWQVWPHDHSFTSNCNINTYNVISGFGYMNYCNFNVELPKDSKPEMSQGFEFLNNAENCNYNLQALDSNLFNYRSGVDHSLFFEDLNKCNLNLLVNNTVGFGYSFGNNFNNCNIVFDNIKADLLTFTGWDYLYNCNITGNVESVESTQEFIGRSDGLNINLNAAKSSRILPLWRCNNVKGNIVAGGDTWITYGNYMNLNVSRGSLHLTWIEHSIFNFNGTNTYPNNINNCMFEIYNCNDFAANNVSNCNFNMRNGVGTAVLGNLNNVDFVERGGANYTINGINSCYNSWIYANNLDGAIDSVYNTRLELKNNNPHFWTWNVDKCELTGFPTSAAYTTNCTFNASLPVVAFRNGIYLTWNNVWPHATPGGSDGWDTWYRTKAGLRSVDNFSGCYLNCNNGSLLAYGGSENFNNINNMQTDIKKFYNGTVTANLPIYNMEIKLNVDCSILNLGIFQAGPPHGFQNATISANTIYAKGSEPGAYVSLGLDTKLYCENYCNTAFQIDGVQDESSVLQPVMLINNYRHSNSGACDFHGGLTRIGRLTYQGGVPVSLYLNKGACVFINNTVFSNILVDNSLLFVGSNYVWTGTVNVTNGGRIVTLSDWDSSALSFVERKSLAWNIWDSGPWGSRSLLNYCLNV